MRSCDFFWLLTFCYLLWDDVISWQDYSECDAPVQLFLAMTFGTFIFIITFLSLAEAFDPVGNCFGCLFHWILNPFLIYLAVQGFIWQIENMIETPDCVPNERAPYMIWVWLLCISLMAISLTVLTVMRVRDWVQERLQMRRWIAQRDAGALYQPLLRADNGTGLLSSEIDQIPKQSYSHSFFQKLRRSHSNSCPICFEDYNAGEQLLVLPKCNHFFHSACITGWLSNNLLCPICRSNVRANLNQNLGRQVEEQQILLDPPRDAVRPPEF